MKQFSFEPLKQWFGFTRRERRASFILLLLILVIGSARYILPAQKMSVTETALELKNANAEQYSFRNEYGRQQEYLPKNTRQQKPLVDINNCDSASLEALPGIGPVLAARIIKYRNLLGGFAAVDQLREVYGLPEETYELVAGRVMADSSDVRKINVNGAEFKELIRLPYFEKYEVSAIMKYRELNGTIGDINVLIENKIIALEKARKVRPYLEFGE